MTPRRFFFFNFFFIIVIIFRTDATTEPTAEKCKTNFTNVDPHGGNDNVISNDFRENCVIVITLRRTSASAVDPQKVYKAFRKAFASALRVEEHDVFLFHPNRTTMDSDRRVMIALRSPGGQMTHWLPSHLIHSFIKQRFDKLDGSILSFAVMEATFKAVIETDGLRSDPIPSPPRPADSEVPKSLLRRRRQTKSKECRDRGYCDNEYEGSGCRCICDFGYNGPTCEQLKMTLNSSTSHVVSETIPKSGNFHFTLYYITANDDGNGFLASLKSKDGQNHMDIFLKKGVPNIRLHGVNGNYTWSVTDVTNKNAWIRIDILKEGNQFVLLIDLCEKSLLDLPKCSSTSGDVPSSIDFKDGQLTLGKPAAGQSFFNDPDSAIGGCIGNVRVNGKLLDLPTSGEKPQLGCKSELVSCGFVDKSQYGFCGRYGVCDGRIVNTKLYTCRCRPGYRPSQPNIKHQQSGCERTSPYYVPTSGYVKWELKGGMELGLAESEASSFEVSFRTIQNDAILYIFRKVNDYIKVLIENGQPKVILKAGTDTTDVSLTSANASDGQWHDLSVHRVGRLLEIRMDNVYYGFKYSAFKDQRLLIYNDVRVIGNNVTSSGDRINFEGCMKDVRILRQYPWVPLSPNIVSINSLNNYLKDVISVNVTQDSCTKQTYCDRHHPCDATRNVVPVRWGACNCICKDGLYETVGRVDCVPSICKPSPCNNGTCNVISEYSRTYNCSCNQNFRGTNCTIFIPPKNDTRTAGFAIHWILLIVLGILLLLLLLLVLLFVCYRRSKQQVDDDIHEVLEEFDNIPEKVGDDCDGAGEEDFGGYIDIGLLRKPTVPLDSRDNLMPLSNAPYDSPPGGWKNPAMENDEHLDHPLEYGYEGEGSFISLSSIASGSTDDDLNFDHLKQWGPRFNSLSDLYGRPDE